MPKPTSQSLPSPWKIGFLIMLFLGWSAVIWSRATSVSRPLSEENQILSERLTIAAQFCDPLPTPLKALLLQLARVVETNPERLAVINCESLPLKTYEKMSSGYRLYGFSQRESHPDTNTTDRLKTFASQALVRLNACFIAFSAILLVALASLVLGPRRSKPEFPSGSAWNPSQVLSLYFAWEILSHFGIGRFVGAAGTSLSVFERVCLSTFLTAAFPMILLMIGAQKMSWRPFESQNWRTSWGWIGPTYALCLIGLPAINTLMETLLGYSLSDGGFVHLLAAQSQPAKIVGLIMIAAILGPLYEEVMFRGLLLGGLTPQLGSRKALLLTAFLFAVAHGDAGHFPALFIFGYALGWLYLRTATLWSSIAVHVMWNASVLCLLFATIP